MNTHNNLEPEFSRVVGLETLKDEPLHLLLRAEEPEMIKLVERFDLLCLSNLTAKIVLRWLEIGNVLSVEGSFSASVTQRCVVTLEPVEEEISEKIVLNFARDLKESADVVDLNSAELLEGEVIDVGEVIAEELSLSLNPYPRCPEIDLSELQLGPGSALVSESGKISDVSGNNPFLALAKLKLKI